MTVDALIEIVLRQIRDDFYGQRDREYFRDQRALTKAIARYGFECNFRHWEFSTEDIRKELVKLLNSMRDKASDIAYLPTYLEGAIDRHIRFRADELNERGKDGRNIIGKTMGAIKPAPIREATPVEILGTLYKDLKQRRRRRKTVKLTKEKQGDLL
jgi:hypothetical protein